MSYSRLSPSLSVSVTCILRSALWSSRPATASGRYLPIDRSSIGRVRGREGNGAGGGIEPPRLSPPEPKSGASTSSATPAVSAGLTRPICFWRSISACPLCAIKKYRTDALDGSFAHHRCYGDGKEACREQNPGCAVGMRPAKKSGANKKRPSATKMAAKPRDMTILRMDRPLSPQIIPSILGATRSAPKWDKWRDRSGRRPGARGARTRAGWGIPTSNRAARLNLPLLGRVAALTTNIAQPEQASGFRWIDKLQETAR